MLAHFHFNLKKPSGHENKCYAWGQIRALLVMMLYGVETREVLRNGKTRNTGIRNTSECNYYRTRRQAQDLDGVISSSGLITCLKVA